MPQLQLENYGRLLYNCWKICSPTVNDLIDAGGVSVILGPQVAGAFNRREAFILITVTNSTKLIWFP